MKKVIKLNENDIENLVKKIIKESPEDAPFGWYGGGNSEENDDIDDDDDHNFHEVYLFLDTLSLPEEEKVRLGNLIYDYGQEMWEEGARGGFADKYM